MKPWDDRFTIFVVCDSPSHARTQAVTNFVRSTEDDGYDEPWFERYPGSRKSGSDSAVTLVGNEPADTNQHGMGDRDYWSRARAVYELECRKCRRGGQVPPPYQWRRETLWAAFNSMFETLRGSYGDVGVLPVSLRQISATIKSLPKGMT